MKVRQKKDFVGQRVRRLRKEREMTQSELASRIGIIQSDLCRMEKGEYKVGLDTLFKILQVFDLKMGEFFGETEKAEDAEARELVSEFLELSSEAQREVRNFVRFKKLQQQDEKPEPGSSGVSKEKEEETS